MSSPSSDACFALVLSGSVAEITGFGAVSQDAYTCGYIQRRSGTGPVAQPVFKIGPVV